MSISGFMWRVFSCGDVGGDFTTPVYASTRRRSCWSRIRRRWVTPGAAGRSWSYEWGVDSTLTRITQTGADGKPAVGGVKISYGYAPDGLLLSRAPAGGQVEHVTWNRLAGLSRMLALAGTEFVYGLGQAPVAQTTTNKADSSCSAGLVWLHTDRLGSVVTTNDTSGGVSPVSVFAFPSTGLGECSALSTESQGIAAKRPEKDERPKQ